MQPEPKFFLEGKQFVVFWHRSGDRNDPLDFFDSLPVKTRLTLAGTIQSYADEGKVPSRASGHEQAWLHLTPPAGRPGVHLFKFKDDPRIRFYSVSCPDGAKERLVLVYGFQDPKKGRERDRHSLTGMATKKAERITLDFILSLRSK